MSASEERQASLRKKSPLTLEDVMKTLSASISTLAKEQSANFTLMSSTLRGIEDTQTKIIAKHDELAMEVQTLHQKYSSINSEIHQTSSEINSVRDDVKVLKLQINQLRQEKIQQNVVFTGFPANIETSALVNHVIDFAKNLNIVISRSDILNAFIIKTKTSHKHIVKFNNVDLKTRILIGRKGRSIFSDEIGVQNWPRTQIYLQEDLTVSTQQLLYNARKLTKEAGYFRVMSANGVIFAKKTSKSPKIKIQSIDQINSLLAKFKLDSERATGDQQAATAEQTVRPESTKNYHQNPIFVSETFYDASPGSGGVLRL
jgi:hypothetical protein